MDVTSTGVPGKQDCDPLLLVVAGPTASGKTALSLALAERFAGEIVNCDSVAVYREFQIGTAKPTTEERARVPHHLLDIVSPNEAMSAGDYARRAREVVAEISSRGKLPIVTGGTGFYLRALLDGLFEGPERSEALRERLRARADGKGPDYLHRILRRLDASAASRIHANDIPKVIRAIEVSLLAKQPMTEMWEQGRDPLRGFRILRMMLEPDRNALYTRINERAARMFEAGLIEETALLMQKYPDSPVLNTLGYKQAVQHLRGEIDRKLCVWSTQQGHRNYAKRQMTWFRREPEMHFLKGFGDEIGIRSEAIELVCAELGDLSRLDLKR